METIELIQQSKVIAQIAFDAAKISDPRTPGNYTLHQGVGEGDHEVAKRLLQIHLQPGDRPLQYKDQPVYPETLQAARELVNFLQEGMGWGNPARIMSCKADPELSVAGMLQYQKSMRERIGKSINDRVEHGLQYLSREFTKRYISPSIMPPEQFIQAVDYRINPIFDDGLRLSDYLVRSAISNDPRLNQLVKALAAGTGGYSPATDPDQVRLRAAMREQRERGEAFAERNSGPGM